MIEATEFGKTLKEKRKAAALTQGDVAAVIHKTGQYISNIEKGKNSAPPNPSDIEALICILRLDRKEASEFRRLAAADRNRLTEAQMKYLLGHKTLLALIDYGVENEIVDSVWQNLLSAISSNGMI